MNNEFLSIDDNHMDDAADVKIAACLNLENPKSFFLFAGAGSGKTRSLVKVLEEVKASIGERLRLNNQQIGVITYTKNARDEIKRRLKNNKLIYVSTIHSFIWDLIREFDTDIKKRLLDTLKDDITKLESKSSRAETKAEADRINKIENRKVRLEGLRNIKKFVYNPNSNNTEREALNHAEVLQIGAYFLTHKPLMQKILIKKFPILLIDESQDTNKDIMDAFLFVQQNNKIEFSLGLLGDTMQRIYGDGKNNLGVNLPEDWETPAKKMNHRSQKRIINLINKIRSDVDSQEQKERQDKQGGVIRLFVIPHSKDKQAAEIEVMQQMATITGDNKWNTKTSIASLILEHHMAASRMGFMEMFTALYPVESFMVSFMDGTLPEIKIFSKIILPILEAHKVKDKFTIANIVKNNSLLFKKSYMKTYSSEAKNILEIANTQIKKLCKAYDDNQDITFRDLLEIVYTGGIFGIPNEYKPILMRTTKENVANIFEIEVEDNEESLTDKINCLDNFLNTKFSQVKPYAEYVNGEASFFTHQSVKGLEFPRVMVVIDDKEARGFSFSYEKLFEIKDKTSVDLQNEKEGKETGIDRTRRLFYVVCSRAKESLAVVAYTDNTEKLKENLSGKGWFADDEIIVI